MAFLRNHFSAVGLFILCTAVLTGLFYPPFLLLGPDGGGAPYALGAMFSPMVAAFLTCWVFHIPLRKLGWRPGPARYLLQSFLIPLAYLALAYGGAWALGFWDVEDGAMRAVLRADLGMPEGAAMGRFAITFLAFVLLQSLVSGLIVLGEEVGWRGFLTPALYARYGFIGASIGTGVLWGLWHMPLIVVSHEGAAPLWYAILCFMITITAVSFVYTWYRMKSGSLWTAVLLHAGHNAVLTHVLTPMSAPAKFSDYVVGEYGAALVGVTLALAALTVARWHVLPAPLGQDQLAS